MKMRIQLIHKIVLSVELLQARHMVRVEESPQTLCAFILKYMSSVKCLLWAAIHATERSAETPNWPCLESTEVRDTLGRRVTGVRTYWVTTGPVQARASKAGWIQAVSRHKLFKNM